MKIIVFLLWLILVTILTIAQYAEMIGNLQLYIISLVGTIVTFLWLFYGETDIKIEKG